jgi:hypothetical protein
MKVLVIEIGGSHVKCLASGERSARKFASRPLLTPDLMVEAVLKLPEDRHLAPPPAPRAESEKAMSAPCDLVFLFAASREMPPQLALARGTLPCS